MTAPLAKKPLGYLTTSEAARLVHRAERTLERLCKATLEGQPTLGWSLDVVQVAGRGGQAGTSYAIRADSLPLPAGRAASDAPAGAVDEPFAARDLRTAVANQPKKRAALQHRLAILAPILARPPASPDREAALDAVALARGITKRTLRKWLVVMAAEGVTGLVRKPTPGPRVTVSRDFDAAWYRAGGAPAMLDEICAALVRDLESMWASEIGDAGAGMVGRLACFTLQRLAREHGVTIDIAQCHVTARLLKSARAARAIHVRDHDAEGHRNGLPRIARTFAGCRPMDHVYLDVRYAPQPIITGGKTVYPMQVAFYDAATGRLFQVVFPRAAHENATGDHVFAAFVQMVNDPQWGLPKTLYYDGGGENHWVVKLAAALASHPEFRFKEIKVAPYSPQSKPIEGAFSVFGLLCMACIRHFPGFKTKPARKAELAAKAAETYPGSWHDYIAEIHSAAAMFNAISFNGRPSRQARYEALVAEGHTPRLANDFAFEALGAEYGLRKPHHARIQVSGSAYTSEQLWRTNPKTPVGIARDPTGLRAPLMVDQHRAEPLRPDPPFPQRTPEEQARAQAESQHRKQVHERALDERKALLSQHLTQKDRIEAAVRDGTIALAPSGIIDGAIMAAGEITPSTIARLDALAAIRNRQGGGNGAQS